MISWPSQAGLLGTRFRPVPRYSLENSEEKTISFVSTPPFLSLLYITVSYNPSKHQRAHHQHSNHYLFLYLIDRKRWHLATCAGRAHKRAPAPSSGPCEGTLRPCFFLFIFFSVFLLHMFRISNKNLNLRKSLRIWKMVSIQNMFTCLKKASEFKKCL